RVVLLRELPQLEPRGRQPLLLRVRLALSDQERRAQGDQDDDGERRADDDCRILLAQALARRELLGKQVDGAHQSSIPSPIATASEPTCSRCANRFGIFSRASGSPTTTCTPIRRSSSSARPGRRVVPPVSTISPIPRLPGWFW